MPSILDNDPVFFRLRGPVLPSGQEARYMLGRIVRNFAQPIGSGYCPEDPTPFHIGAPTETKWQNAHALFDKTQGGGFELQVSGVGGGEVAGGRSKCYSIRNSEVLAIELRHQPEVYRKLLTNTEISQWIKENCTLNKPLFMITGLLVWRDAVQTEQKTSGQSFPQWAISRARSKWKVPQVFAVEYKVIRKRRRNIFRGFAPVFQDRGPSVDADRQYADDSEEEKEDVAEDFLPELELDLPWNEILEDSKEDPALEVEEVELGSSVIQFI